MVPVNYDWNLLGPSLPSSDQSAMMLGSDYRAATLEPDVWNIDYIPSVHLLADRIGVLLRRVFIVRVLRPREKGIPRDVGDLVLWTIGLMPGVGPHVPGHIAVTRVVIVVL